MGKVNMRDVSPMLQKLRDILSGRTHISPLRFPHEVASRSPQHPNLPEGPHHTLNNNYYFARDARREVEPPPVISGQGCSSSTPQKPRTELNILPCIPHMTNIRGPNTEIMSSPDRNALYNKGKIHADDLLIR
ncbi:hypothetical protein FQA39_LY15137 [Lamprigera yunnana]|nr:hypothetical protein FQA39_LY15137 [Lamprigera yunnana]